jgi:hypothetical protein
LSAAASTLARSYLFFQNTDPQIKRARGEAERGAGCARLRHRRRQRMA